MNKLTPNLVVDRIEPMLDFYVKCLGFEKTVEVPLEGTKELGFVILRRGKVELMLQSRASVEGDVPALAGGAHRSILYIEVDSLDDVRARLKGVAEVVPERTTAYGAREIIVKDPAGNCVFFAAH